LARKYNSNSARRRIFDGAAEAKLIALTLSPAPEGFRTGIGARLNTSPGRTDTSLRRHHRSMETLL
jgi:hypothetical protein